MLRKILDDLRKNGKMLFVLSNFQVDFMAIAMEATLGIDWIDFFDICIADARSPLFHSAKQPF